MEFGISLSGITNITAKVSAVVITFGLASCSGGSNNGGGSVSLVGAGASFPSPIYQRWFQELGNTDLNIQVDYQSVGSGAGVERFTQELVDFGASDVAMKDDEIAKVGRGVILLPMTAGSVVLAYNLPDISGLKLSRKVYVDILLGKITNWNDPKIAEINPDLTLPDQAITVVYRSDGSGTTGVFTQHLSAISPEWKEKVGEGKTVQWLTGIGGAKNDGVTAQIKQTEGTIGYVEYGYAKSAGLSMASLENQAGKYIEPAPESAAATLAAVTLPENLRAFITDPEGEDSYPIVTYTWMLVYGSYDDADKATGIEKMIEYGLNEGQQVSSELGYIPLPENVRQKVLEAADKISPDYTMTLK
ncbi:phosphate ABC transporter substrate-binding protein PstS [Okeania sp.]|uniref:phosphate ABC transporter substrate-binding protein PstS n=1 Tax=Okeania sp. TaxID=3100323 RepID=UPI002B4AADD6|nr:phosphate ABC transporter substrate-binding protein PstS [Okeania sp.]MEB3343509.1 phosphate ABC transporter substrate-binding protein PstS [Okeania sp.]